MTLALNPSITLREANRFVAGLHRHHKPDRGCKFLTSVVANGNTVGVAIVGRPKSRTIQTKEPLTCEITRVCTDGTKNACSMLYGACRRAAFGQEPMSNKYFSEIVAGLAEGDLDERVTKRLSELAQKVEETGGTGKLTLTLTVKKAR